MSMENEKSAPGVNELVEVVSQIDDSALMYDFLECLLTPTELSDVGKRWLLVRELDEGTTQRDIAHMFGMSLCKVTRGARELKKENSAFRRVLEMIRNGEIKV